jgi:hypothetical protein
MDLHGLVQGELYCKCVVDSAASGQDPVSRSFEYTNVHLDFTRVGEFLDLISECEERACFVQFAILLSLFYYKISFFFVCVKK